tara:strand:- start:284 stop:466 length:183 start_codon:yes stop_codon:yes gene_type:complete
MINPYEPPAKPYNGNENTSKRDKWLSMLILCFIFGTATFFPLIVDTISYLFFVYKYGVGY